MKYDNHQIAKELRHTAENSSHYGSSLLAARDLLPLCEQREAVMRYLSGRQNDTDHIRLHEAANMIEALP